MQVDLVQTLLSAQMFDEANTLSHLLQASFHSNNSVTSSVSSNYATAVPLDFDFLAGRAFTELAALILDQALKFSNPSTIHKSSSRGSHYTSSNSQIKYLVRALVRAFLDRETILKRHAHLLLEKKNGDVGSALGQSAALYYTQSTEINENLNAILMLRSATLSGSSDMTVDDQKTLKGFIRYLAGLYQFRAQFYRRCANELFKSENNGVGTIMCLYASLIVEQSQELSNLADTGISERLTGFNSASNKGGTHAYNGNPQHKYLPDILENLVNSVMPEKSFKPLKNHDNEPLPSIRIPKTESSQTVQVSSSSYSSPGDDKTPPTNNFSPKNSYEEAPNQAPRSSRNSHKVSYSETLVPNVSREGRAKVKPLNKTTPTSILSKSSSWSKDPGKVDTTRRKKNDENEVSTNISLQGFTFQMAGAYKEESIALNSKLTNLNSDNDQDVKKGYGVMLRTLDYQSNLLIDRANQSSIDTIAGFMMYLSRSYREMQRAFERTADNFPDGAMQQILLEDAESLEQQGEDLHSKSNSTPNVAMLRKMLIGFYKERATTFRALTRKKKIRTDSAAVFMLKQHADILDNCTLSL